MADNNFPSSDFDLLGEGFIMLCVIMINIIAALIDITVIIWKYMPDI